MVRWYFRIFLTITTKPYFGVGVVVAGGGDPPLPSLARLEVHGISAFLHVRKNVVATCLWDFPGAMEPLSGSMQAFLGATWA